MSTGQVGSKPTGEPTVQPVKQEAPSTPLAGRRMSKLTSETSPTAEHVEVVASSVITTIQTTGLAQEKLSPSGLRPPSPKLSLPELQKKCEKFVVELAIANMDIAECAKQIGKLSQSQQPDQLTKLVEKVKIARAAKDMNMLGLYEALQAGDFIHVDESVKLKIIEKLNTTLDKEGVADFIAFVFKEEMKAQQLDDLSRPTTISTTLYSQFVAKEIGDAFTKQGVIGKQIEKYKESNVATITEAFNAITDYVQGLRNPVLTALHKSYLNAVEHKCYLHAVEIEAKKRGKPLTEEEKRKIFEAGRPLFEREAIKQVSSLLFLRVIAPRIATLGKDKKFTDFAKAFQKIVIFPTKREVFEIQLEPQVYKLASALADRKIISISPMQLQTFIKEIIQKQFVQTTMQTSEVAENLDNYMRVLRLVIGKSMSDKPNFSDLEIYEKEKLPLHKIMVDHFDLLETIVGKKQAEKLIPEKLYLYIFGIERQGGKAINIDGIIKYLEQYKKEDVEQALREHYDDIFEGGLEKVSELKEKLASELGIVVTKP